MPENGAAPATALPPGRPAGEALWDDWDAPPRVPPVPALHLDGFDGPMDLLLELAERQRIDLGRLSIVALVEQFVSASERLAAHVPIERRAEWLVLAARLVLLRARLLAPATPQAAADAAREADRETQRLAGLSFVRAAAAWLQARPQLGQEVFARGRQGPDPRTSSYMALLEACLTVLRGRDGPEFAEEPAYRPPLPARFGVPQALARMRAQLAAIPAPAPLVRFLPRLPADLPDRERAARAAVSSTLVAALELARTAEAALDDGDRFETVRLGTVGAGQ